MSRSRRAEPLGSVVGFLLVTVLLLGCAAAPGPTGGEDPVAGEVVVSAAASLTEAFTEIAALFEATHPGTTVTLNFAGSQTLASQIVQGAPIDVFASANQAQMAVVAEEGLATSVELFGSNDLAIAVQPGNPSRVRSLADLADPDLVVVLAAPDVPAGAAAAEILHRAGVEVTPASFEPDVRAALSRVELGEADAAVVYTSDIGAREDAVEGVEIAPDQNTTVEYPATVLTDAANPSAASAFLQFLLSADGQDVLVAHGFGAKP